MLATYEQPMRKVFRHCYQIRLENVRRAPNPRHNVRGGGKINVPCFVVAVLADGGHPETFDVRNTEKQSAEAQRFFDFSFPHISCRLLFTGFPLGHRLLHNVESTAKTGCD